MFLMCSRLMVAMLFQRDAAFPLVEMVQDYLFVPLQYGVHLLSLVAA